jgi:hypothetical protein
MASSKKADVNAALELLFRARITGALALKGGLSLNAVRGARLQGARRRRWAITLFKLEDAALVISRQSDQTLFRETVGLFGETPAALDLLSKIFDVHHSPPAHPKLISAKRLLNGFFNRSIG